ncbi:MAG: hypothetical protein ACOYKZ_02230 [Chlamydiia bacterium]
MRKLNWLYAAPLMVLLISTTGWSTKTIRDIAKSCPNNAACWTEACAHFQALDSDPGTMTLQLNNLVSNWSDIQSKTQGHHTKFCNWCAITTSAHAHLGTSQFAGNSHLMDIQKSLGTMLKDCPSDCDFSADLTCP